ncbi:hypothetical protein GPALN_003237 [Globodera pallida]|uniref:Helicase C-terminal domain-containing protein n=1 Tax=Globodera pallida TaxID=36090 RepID=A0A183CT91_GLOPA|nr:hypothetical protein GPALN_003237 [Globodera pallida]
MDAYQLRTQHRRWSAGDNGRVVVGEEQCVDQIEYFQAEPFEELAPLLEQQQLLTFALFSSQRAINVLLTQMREAFRLPLACCIVIQKGCLMLGLLQYVEKCS